MHQKIRFVGRNLRSIRLNSVAREIVCRESNFLGKINTFLLTLCLRKIKIKREKTRRNE